MKKSPQSATRDIGPQLQLPLAAAPAPDGRVLELVEFLHHHGDWVRAAKLCWLVGEANTESGRRRVRALAEAAAPDVISGQRGYKHVEWATADETARFIGWTESQARKMTARAEAVRRRMHALIGQAGKPPGPRRTQSQ
jgi:hypothetical protein